MQLFKKETVKKGSYIRKIIRFCGMKISYGKELDITSVLNTVVDITKCPKATGKLRKLQQADTLLLKIFDSICSKYHIPYTIAFGNLLGAVRHKGFVPWDDDIDVWVMIDDYDRTIKAVQHELKKYDFEFYGVDKSRLGDITFRVSHKDMPSINLDIFYLIPSKHSVDDKNALKKIWENIGKQYKKQYKKIKNNETEDKLSNLRKVYDDKYKSLVEYCPLENAKSVIANPYATFVHFNTKDFYPFKPIQFENFEVMGPNNPSAVLSGYYGDYMSFPDNFFRHNDAFTKFDDTETDCIIEKLKCIADEIKK